MTIRLLKPAAIISATFLLLILLSKPSYATTIEVTGNGSDSTSTVAVSQNNQTTVQQTNTATVTNNVSATSDTGNNTASSNTGGAVSIQTGDASTLVKINNSVNGSDLNPSSNGGEVSSTHNQNSTVNTAVVVSGNGSDSHSVVILNFNRLTGVTQNNSGSVLNNVDAAANTGGNNADHNTGGSVFISTGNAHTEVLLTNNVNHNSAVVPLCGCIGTPFDPGKPANPGTTPPPTEIASVPAATPAVKEAGSVLAAVSILPATGATSNSNWVIFAALILIALGFYLRKKTEDWYFAYYNI